MTWVCRLHEEVIGASFWCSEERDQHCWSLCLFIVFLAVLLNVKNPRESVRETIQPRQKQALNS